jgi:DNA-binding response OmpR family regulator
MTQSSVVEVIGLTLPMKARILVVDDDHDSAFAISVMLKEHGFSAEWYTDPHVALSSFCKGKYNLVLLDARMPGIDGFALFESIHKIDPLVRPCFLTASYERGYEDMRNRLPDLSSHCFLRKPVTLSNLTATVDSILSQEVI